MTFIGRSRQKNWELSNTSFLPICLIALVCWLVYFNSLLVPFYLDDISSITNNKFFEGASYNSLFNDYGLRFLGYVSLWLNYEYAHLDVVPYHIVNVTIHMLNGMCVYFLVFKLVVILDSFDSKKQRILFASIVGLVFVLHPLQSQGVTYIVQRLASQVTLFYLASVTFYLFFRTVNSIRNKLAFLVLALICAVAACLTKQNAFTLPLILLLSEWVLFKIPRKKHVVWGAMFCIFSVVIVYFLPVGVGFGDLVRKLDAISRETNDTSRLDYFLAQMPILWDYIGKIFWPWPLHLEYDYTVTSFEKWVVVISVFGHLVLIAIAIFVRKSFPLITWGVLFYYLTHMIESGVVPITDVAFEHRAYLPNVGLFIAIAFSIFFFSTKLIQNKPQFKMLFGGASLAIFMILGFVTIERNKQWLNPESFLENDMAQAPANARAIHNFAEYKLKQGEVQTALSLLEQVYELDLKRMDVMILNTHLALLIESKRYNEAIEKGHFLLGLPLRENAKALINSNMGILYTNLGQYGEAEHFFETAYTQDNLTISSLIAFAYTSFVGENYTRSTALCNEILRAEPQHSKAKLLLSMISEKVKK